MKTRALLRKLALYYPQKIRERGDFGGLMVGKLPENVGKILVCLDFDDEVYPTLLKEKPDIVITHHPFIYGKKSYVLAHDEVKRDLYQRMEKLRIPVLSYHTNFDNSHPWGMNDALAEALGLRDAKPLENAPMAVGGKLKKPMEVHEFASYAKERLGVSYGLLIPKGKPVVSNVALIGGGGWFENELAQQGGFDIYISGDCPHHGRREIVLRHYNYLDLPHEIEHIFMKQITKILLNIDNALTIVSIDHEKLPEIV